MSGFIFFAVMAVVLFGLAALSYWNLGRVDRLKARGEFKPMSSAARVVVVGFGILFFISGVMLLAH